MSETDGGPTGSALPAFAWRPIVIVLAVQVAVLTALSSRYGFHRDELYFMVAGKHPAWGYVDQPPLTPMLARASTAVFGASPMGLRVVATLMGAATVVITALTAREFGGGRAAQTLTAIATALSAYTLVVSHMVSTATADLLVWTAAGLLLVRVLRTGDGRWWLAVGAVVGVGILNKWLIVFLVGAVGIGILALGPRRSLRSGWLAAGIVVALLIAAPTMVWQATHGWPQFTVARGISDQDGTENRILFVPEQLVYLSPVLVPVWVAGFRRLWRTPRLRAIALAYPVLSLAILVTGGKPYYAVPVLLIFVAAGADPWLRAYRHWRPSETAVIGLCVVISLLVGLPILPTSALGPVLPVNAESGEQVGWPHFVDTVATAWRRIPAGQRGTAVVFTVNYGQAGAIARYGPERGLPRPYSGHMSFADWGPPPDSQTGPILLVGQGSRQAFTGCRIVARNHSGIDNDENGTPISLCTGLAGPWSAVWPHLRRYY